MNEYGNKHKKQTKIILDRDFHDLIQISFADVSNQNQNQNQNEEKYFPVPDIYRTLCNWLTLPELEEVCIIHFI